MKKWLIGTGIGLGLGLAGLVNETRAGFLFVVGAETEFRELKTEEAVHEIRDSIRTSGYILGKEDNFRTVTDNLALTNYNSILAGEALRDTNVVLGNTNEDDTLFLPEELNGMINYKFQPLINSEQIVGKIEKTGKKEIIIRLIYDNQPLPM